MIGSVVALPRAAISYASCSRSGSVGICQGHLDPPSNNAVFETTNGNGEISHHCAVNRLLTFF